MRTVSNAVARVVLAACSIVACDSTTSPPPDETFASQGIVAGFVRDSGGRGVPNAVVCASAVVFAQSGTPVLTSYQDSTNAQGAYMVRFNLSFPADTAARLTVAATPSAASGLSATFVSGLTVRVTTRFPPAETTYVNLVAPSGPPHSGILCVLGA